jgi:glutamate decarboxylase
MWRRETSVGLSRGLRPFPVVCRARAEVPAYTMPEAATDEAIMRVVIREGFSFDLADDLLAALRSATDYLTANPPRTSTASHGFSHT